MNAHRRAANIWQKKGKYSTQLSASRVNDYTCILWSIFHSELFYYVLKVLLPLSDILVTQLTFRGSCQQPSTQWILCCSSNVHKSVHTIIHHILHKYDLCSSSSLWIYVNGRGLLHSQHDVKLFEQAILITSSQFLSLLCILGQQVYSIFLAPQFT